MRLPMGLPMVEAEAGASAAPEGVGPSGDSILSWVVE